ncbi:MAG: hypothetical protein MMC23_009016 [Stictis urceolatum]|nr:hypothetical protein [Stictis urceolata]
MSNTTYLITGANRGIGLGLTGTLLKRPNTTVIAAVRNPFASTSLTSLPTGPNSTLITISIDATFPESAHSAIKTLQSEHSISKIDVVIANAGISDYYGPATITPIEEVTRHYNVNVIGPLALFQATYPLLKKSSNPKFVGISTGAASIGDMGDWPLECTAYGSSKAALNYWLVKAHHENPDITIFPISPGWVATDMGNKGAKSAGMEQAPVKVEDSVAGLLEKVDGATREKTSGTFQSYDDMKFNW